MSCPLLGRSRAHLSLKSRPDLQPTNMHVIAVTGATGFIGRRFVQVMAARRDVEARALVRTNRNTMDWPRSVRTFLGDFTQASSLAELLVGDCTVVNLVHLEGMTLPGVVDSVQSFLEACIAARVRRIVHCSTAVVAGRTVDTVITEDTECVPGDAYEISKLAIEQAFLERSDGRIEVTILRPTAVFGPGGRNLMKLANDIMGRSLVAAYVASCLQGRRRMNLVHVDNVVAALAFLVEARSDTSGKAFIISDDDNPANNFHDVERQLRARFGLPDYRIPVLELPPSSLSLALRLLGRTNTNPSRIYDCSRILGLGLERPMPFRQGLDQFCDWYVKKQRAG